MPKKNYIYLLLDLLTKAELSFLHLKRLHEEADLGISYVTLTRRMHDADQFKILHYEIRKIELIR